MLLDAPSPALIKTFACCPAVEWGRLRAAHRCLQAGDEVLLGELGLPSNLESQPSLNEAAQEGLLHVVLARLRSGEDPDQREEQQHRYTPLLRAAYGGHRPIVHQLLRARASANARDRLGFCALHFVANQSAGLAEELISARCDVVARGLSGFMPLHSAARMGRGDICRLLMEARAPVHAAVPGGATPASMAQRAAAGRCGAEREACEALARTLAARALEANEGAAASTAGDAPKPAVSEQPVD
uniref:Uncharacterized protein n=1 Tax=Alexandrium monilatum TaxID=311494 RepID=A0A7S4SBU3_9DINO|mmetsp:Transcript_9238/g.27931  ORF Transcript_9238/g.27931 Transcript_9238/m.27931 type:complete len:244 (+) Transcript_9238:71-802(+)